MIEFNQVKKSYGLNQVLDVDHFSLSEGIYWLVGENGSGKSTLLKAIAGIIDFEGSIRLDNAIDLKQHPLKFRNLVNFAEAEPIFPDFLTGHDLISLFADAKSASSIEPKTYLEQLKIHQYLGDPISTYSSGMRKKLSLILAFLGKPRLILLDEPLVTIDAEALNVVYMIIKELHFEKGISFILSSHQKIESNDLKATRVLLEDRSIKLA